MLKIFGKSKITYFALVIFHQDVGWLQVAMDDSIHVEVFDAFHYLFEKTFGLFLLNFAFLLQKVVKVTIFAEFGNDVHVVGGLVDIKEFDDVSVVYLFHDFYFRLNIFDVVAVGEESFVDDFDCNFFSGLDDFSHIDVGV